MSKILIIVTKGEVGGAQMSVLNLAKKLESLEQDVLVGFGNGEFLKKNYKNPQFHINDSNI